MWLHIQNLNFNVLKAKGHSNIVLKLEIIIQIVIILSLVVTASFGIFYICIGSVVASIVNMFISSYYTGRVLQYGMIKQMKEMLPSLFYSLLMGGIMYISILFLPTMWLKLLIGVLVGIFSFFSISFVTKSQDLSYLFALIREKIKK